MIIFLAASLIAAALLVNPTQRQISRVSQRIRRLERLEDLADRYTAAEIERLVADLKTKVLLIKKSEVWTYLSICFFLIAGMLGILTPAFPAAAGFGDIMAVLGILALFGGIFLHIEIRELDLSETLRDIEIFRDLRAGKQATKKAAKPAKK